MCDISLIPGCEHAPGCRTTRKKCAFYPRPATPISASDNGEITVKQAGLRKGFDREGEAPAMRNQVRWLGQRLPAGFGKRTKESAARIFTVDFEVIARPLRRPMQHPSLGSRAARLGGVSGDPAESRILNECTVKTEVESIVESDHGSPAGRHIDLCGSRRDTGRRFGQQRRALRRRRRYNDGIESTEFRAVFAAHAPTLSFTLEPTHRTVKSDVEVPCKMLAYGVHPWDSDKSLGRVIIEFDRDPVELCEPTVPSRHQPVAPPGCHKPLEKRVPHGEVLRTVVESQMVSAPGRHASAGTSRLLKHPHAVPMIRKDTSTCQPRQPGTNDRYMEPTFNTASRGSIGGLVFFCHRGTCSFSSHGIVALCYEGVQEKGSRRSGLLVGMSARQPQFNPSQAG